MRFAASFSNATREIIFHMVSGLARLNDVQICALVFTDLQGLEIRAITDTAAAFGKLRTEEFLSFRVQSKSSNVIVTEVQIGALQAAFRDTSGADEVTLKLTKDNNGDIFLTLTARTVTQIMVTQDVPVLKILNASELTKYNEPEVTADATVYFPDVKAAKKVLDRMKQLDKFVQIKVDQNAGRLVFRVDTEVVSTRTMFNNLRAIDIGEPGEDGSQVNPTGDGHNQFVVASLMSKELASITAGLGTFGKRSTTVLLAIARRTLVCLHVGFDNEATLTYYLATAADDDDARPVLENTQLLRLETLKGEGSREVEDNSDL
jgi:hypothetical protein